MTFCGVGSRRGSGREAREELLEHCRMQRPLEIDACMVGIGPAHLCAERLDPGEADNDMVVHVDELDELSLAAAYRDVFDNDLEAEASHAPHADFGNAPDALIAPAAGGLVGPTAAYGRGARREAAIDHRRTIGKLDELIRPHRRDDGFAGAHALEPLASQGLSQMHWSTAPDTRGSIADPALSSRTWRVEPRSSTARK